MTAGSPAEPSRPGRPSWLRKRPGPLGRRLLRLPIWIYRLRLGFLLGHRFLVVTHVGRRTHTPHQTMLEVVRWDAASREAVVMSPWPKKADWYQNLLAEPAREVWIGARRYRPAQRLLDGAEVAEVLDAYARRSRTEAAGLERLFAWREGLAESDRSRLLQEIAGIAFRPTL